MDLIDEQDRTRIVLKLLDHLLEPLLEIAAIAGPGEQRTHVEGEHGRAFQHFRHFAVDNPAREAFGDRRLTDAGLADEQRVVLLPAAEHLDGAADLGVAPDQRIDLAFARLLVEVDAVSLERIALLLLLIARLGIAVLVNTARRPRLGEARTFGDAMADVVHRVVARHFLLLQEVGSMALALGEDRDQHIGAGDFLATRRLHVDHGALDHALEAGGGLGVLRTVRDEVLQLGFDIGDEVAPQLVGIDVARLHYGSRVLVVDKREQQVLERGVFMVALVSERERAMERLFEAA